MQDNRYSKPQVKTMTVHEILETLGPVSCGSGATLGTESKGTGGPLKTDGFEHLN